MVSAISIERDVLDKTDKCKKDFSCLSTMGGSMCDVESVLTDDMRIVKCKEPQCSYTVSYGYSNICKCPPVFRRLQWVAWA